MSNRRRPAAARRASRARRPGGDHLHVACGCEPRWLEFMVHPSCPECDEVSPLVGDAHGMAWETGSDIGQVIELGVMCGCGTEYSIPCQVQPLPEGRGGPGQA